MNTPVPGSVAAQIRGCRCPAEVNRQGEGPEGIPPGHFWVNDDCPLHATAEWYVQADELVASRVTGGPAVT